jgi:hypothetical protein
VALRPPTDVAAEEDDGVVDCGPVGVTAPDGETIPEGGEVGLPAPPPGWLPVDVCRFIGLALMRAKMGLSCRKRRLFIHSSLTLSSI